MDFGEHVAFALGWSGRRVQVRSEKLGVDVVVTIVGQVPGANLIGFCETDGTIWRFNADEGTGRLGIPPWCKLLPVVPPSAAAALEGPEAGAGRPADATPSAETAWTHRPEFRGCRVLLDLPDWPTGGFCGEPGKLCRNCASDLAASVLLGALDRGAPVDSLFECCAGTCFFLTRGETATCDLCGRIWQSRQLGGGGAWACYLLGAAAAPSTGAESGPEILPARAPAPAAPVEAGARLNGEGPDLHKSGPEGDVGDVTSAREETTDPILPLPVPLLTVTVRRGVDGTSPTFSEDFVGVRPLTDAESAQLRVVVGALAEHAGGCEHCRTAAGGRPENLCAAGRDLYARWCAFLGGAIN